MLSNRILVVDDDDVRRQATVNKIIELIPDLDRARIDFCADLISAKIKVRRIWYPVVILDMMLPSERFDRSSINRTAGVDFLNFLRTQNFNRPHKIIGISALQENVDLMDKEFGKLGFKMYYASINDYSWLYKEADSIRFTIPSIVELDVKKTLIISVHGINTFGGWQERLEQELLGANGFSITYRYFKYTMFPFLFFYVPYFRKKIVGLFMEDLNRLSEELDLSEFNVVFVGHSFGTYILYRGLMESSNSSYTSNTKRIIFSGSMLSRNTPISQLAEKYTSIVINDCGVNDGVLLLAEIFVPRAGMSGRLGFLGMSNKVVNRFFSGGHSLYFERSDFIKEHWLPLVSDFSITDVSQLAINEGKQTVIEGFLQYVAELVAMSFRFIELCVRKIVRCFIKL